MRSNRTLGFVFGVFGSVWISVASADGLLAGPIESISRDGKGLVVLGQPIALEPGTSVQISGKAFKGAALRTLRVGSYVAAAIGTPSLPRAARTILLSMNQYVPGATPVFVAGVIEKASPVVGTLQIGSLVVDVSSASPEVLSSIAVGSYVEVLGTQPLPSGILIGESYIVYPERGSIGGTGVVSIGGMGLQSIGGTGVLSIGGTGFRSIGGTGAQSIGGTGTQSIGGTGRQSIGGAGVESIGGTGSLSIGGTGALSIGGTGAP